MTSAMLSPLPLPPTGLAAQAQTGGRMRDLRPLPAPGEMPAAGIQPEWPQPFGELPVGGGGEIPPTPLFVASAPPFGKVPAANQRADDSQDFTDDDLREAFGPIVEQAVRRAVYAKENGIDTYLEPMLRATIRRALAEYAPASRPFQPPGVLDRLVWHLRALFTSRTYEEIFFEKTRRFQVEEAFLLDSATLALVSFASCDPARHASVRRVVSTAQRLAAQLRDSSGRFHPELQLSAFQRAIARRGRHVILVAVVRGRANELVLADLEFALRRIEDNFRDQFDQEGSALLHELQPFLEDCLLIQSPATGTAG